MDRPTVSDRSRTAYDAVAGQFAAQPGVKAGQMMGMPTLFADGKAFAGMYGDAMIFKLAGQAHADALGRPGAGLFDPSGMGRPMKAWVQVPAADGAAWADLARQALDGAPRGG